MDEFELAEALEKVPMHTLGLPDSYRIHLKLDFFPIKCPGDCVLCIAADRLRELKFRVDELHSEIERMRYY